jgi:nicotinamidase-related amidase
MGNPRIGSDAHGWSVDADRISLVRSRTPRPVTVGAQPQDLEVDLARTAVVVVDMQNDFCAPGGWLDGIGVDIAPARAPIQPLVEHLPVLRAAGALVVWVNWGTRPDRANLPPGVLHVYDTDGTGGGIGDPVPATGSPTLQKGSWGAALVDELVPEPTDVSVDKHRMSGFWDTDLDSILRNHDIATVLFAGVNADQCVLGTLIDAACIGYDCVLLADASATTSPSFCWEATLYNVAQCFGFVADLADIVAGLADAG